MIDRITVGAASLMGALVAGTGLIRWAVAPPVRRGQHRSARGVTAPLPVSAGVVRQGFGWCEPCAQTMPGVVTRDGFRCDCGTPAGGDR